MTRLIPKNTGWFILYHLKSCFGFSCETNEDTSRYHHGLWLLIVSLIDFEAYSVCISVRFPTLTMSFCNSGLRLRQSKSMSSVLPHFFSKPFLKLFTSLCVYICISQPDCCLGDAVKSFAPDVRLGAHSPSPFFRRSGEWTHADWLCDCKRIPYFLEAQLSRQQEQKILDQSSLSFSDSGSSNVWLKNQTLKITLLNLNFMCNDLSVGLGFRFCHHSIFLCLWWPNNNVLIIFHKSHLKSQEPKRKNILNS